MARRCCPNSLSAHTLSSAVRRPINHADREHHTKQHASSWIMVNAPAAAAIAAECMRDGCRCSPMTIPTESMAKPQKNITIGFADEPAAGQQAPAPSAKQTPEQLEQPVAPVALYPDELVAEVLAAATYPDQVVVADRWL